MAIGALHLFLWIDRVIISDHTAQHLMVLRAVAVGAEKILTPHMYIEVFAGEIQAFIKVTVFDAIAAAAIEMALAAVIACGSAHTLGGGRQVNAFGRVAKIAFCICAGISMTNQAVYILLVGEIIGGFFGPAVAGMTGHAGLLVALGADAEIVDLVDFANCHGLIAPGNFKRFAFPGPVGGCHKFTGRVWVAFQAGFGDFLGSLIRTFHQICMAGMSFVQRKVGSGVIDGDIDGAWPEDDQWDYDDSQGNGQSQKGNKDAWREGEVFFHKGSSMR